MVYNCLSKDVYLSNDLDKKVKSQLLPTSTYYKSQSYLEASTRVRQLDSNKSLPWTVCIHISIPPFPNI
jgi:hypothetical protein